jgi:hypothetical protein
MDLMHVDPVITGSAWAISVLSGVLVLAGLPLASIGLTLSALTKRLRIRWSSWCFWVFQSGFVIQICSVVVTVLLSLILRPFSAPRLPNGTAWEPLVPLIFLGNAVGGVLALAAWRRLMAAVRLEAPPSLVR